MRSLLICMVVVLGISLSGAEEARPNLLFIFIDDFGWRDTGYMGSDFYETPNIDALAAGGMVFTNAYAGAANCAPARACLLSGQYTPRHEIYNVGTGPRGKAAYRRLKHIPGVDTLNPSITTWAKCLQDVGYVTASMGKWHLSDNPCDYGFDINIGGSHSGSPPRGYYPPHPGAPGLKDAKPGEYLTDTLSHHAASFVREHAEEPWVLYLTHFAVHTPLDAKKELLEKYRNKTPGTLHHHVEMATMIEAVDQGVGEIMEALEESGARDRTIIVFYSDNGGYGPATDMDPLKGYKGTYYEGGIRVPFFVNWKGEVEAGQTSDTPITGVDLFPTFCEMLGAKFPEGQALDGVSLLPVLRKQDNDLDQRALFWHFPAYLQSYGKVNGEQRDPLFRSRPCSIVRKGNWKLHEYFEDGGFELYDLSSDPGEEENLADKEPEVFQQLKKELVMWRKDIGAPVPVEPNPDFDAEAEAKAIQKARRAGL